MFILLKIQVFVYIQHNNRENEEGKVGSARSFTWQCLVQLSECESGGLWIYNLPYCDRRKIQLLAAYSSLNSSSNSSKTFWQYEQSLIIKLKLSPEFEWIVRACVAGANSAKRLNICWFTFSSLSVIVLVCICLCWAAFCGKLQILQHNCSTHVCRLWSQWKP